MSYGVTFTNNSDVVVLDSEFSRLVVLQSGTWANTTYISVVFPRPVTTQEPPLVFVRPDTSVTFSFCLVSGAAGNWTGFTFTCGSGYYSTGRYFIAAFKAEPTAKYGFRLWDGASKLIFDSGTPCAQFTRSITSWTYLGYSTTPQGQYRLSWTAPSSLSGGDYMLLNNVAMDIAGSTSRQGNLYAIWNYVDDRIVMQAVGVDLQMTLFIPIIFAKPIS